MVTEKKCGVCSPVEDEAIDDRADEIVAVLQEDSEDTEKAGKKALGGNISKLSYSNTIGIYFTITHCIRVP